MRRRDFIKLVAGSGALWPLASRAEQAAMPVIGFLSSTSSKGYAPYLAAFREGLRQGGFVEGQNVTIEYCWAEDHYERLPGLAADLVHRQVALIAATGGSPAALAAKLATTTIPIVFQIESIRSRLVLSPASTDRAGTSRALLIWPWRLGQSGWSCCTDLSRVRPA
jgi:ABC-type uncharacterized transport system substrate-binding protein